ncbi:PAS domain S-box protein [Mesorhizobium sp. M7A.F.Ca.CA.001.07.2.1]|uniref:PAS domain-containing protein n=4 Tax=Phyllobacteriaceae TaxID=69277 RepID=UPI000FCA84BF|nr:MULTISPECIES: PAS domain-containing protein [Mesorhizobium]RVB41971.1 PAS domain S-box protein [Mesorhizobium sp. M7A.F.Ca.CA.004.05.1.1]MCF6126264.1 PAS domain-containing protein [Mesorhizobium ciceri]MCQ8816276.1 PAS domain-containing protein [Mesorhizobium sp. SEMIA396]RUX82358.1 PAS domain S-box protein [Mesorhizobium sp. M7A.F.Ca.CA.004.08.2.1]RUX83757.1 PAS domain S-box protein [Mesorhizobium sp. M7A.F.Ca.CA.004.08.1.1]
MFRNVARPVLAIFPLLMAIVLVLVSGEPWLLIMGVVSVCAFDAWRIGFIGAIFVTMLFALAHFPPAHLMTEGDLSPAVQTALFGGAALVIFTVIRCAMIFPSKADDRMRFAAAIVDNMPAMGWSLNGKGEYTYTNKAVQNYVTGNERQADLDDWKNAIPLVHPADVEQTFGRLVECLASGEDFVTDCRIQGHDGSYRWFRAVARAARGAKGDITGWYGTSVDIHEQKLVEEALRESERELRQLVDAIPALIWCATPEGEPFYANKQVKAFAGIAIGDLEVPNKTRLREALDVTVHPDDRIRVGDAMMRSFSTGTSFAEIYRLRRHDGMFRWVDSRLAPQCDDTGKIIRWYGVLIDIDESKQAEEALRASERQLQLLVDTVPVMVWCASASGEPTYINRRLNDYAGIRAEKVDQARFDRNQQIDRLIHPDDRERFRRALVESFALGRPFTLRYRHMRHDGHYRWADSRSEPLRDGDGRLLQWYTVITDIDDETRMQEELRSAHERLASASKAASLSELTASIAHEVNQPLASIVASSQACEHWLKADPPNITRAIANVGRITRDANLAADIIRRIRVLFFRTSETRTPVSINELVLDVCRLMENELAVNAIQIRTGPDDGLPSVIGDRIQLQQVLVNLIRNGIDAMERMPPEERVLEIGSRLIAGNRISVEVRDQGSGMEDPHMIFEAFYSTKANGKGIGLAICRSIIEAHDGEIRAENGENGGAVFTFTLPISNPGQDRRDVA